MKSKEEVTFDEALELRKHSELGYPKPVMDVVFTGPVPDYDSLDYLQKHLFNEVVESNGIDGDYKVLYDRIVHNTFLATPRIITVVKSESDYHCFLIADHETSYKMIQDYLGVVPNLIVYGEDQHLKFGRYNAAKRIGIKQAVSIYTMGYDILEDIIAVNGMDMDIDMLKHPHAMWRDQVDRAMASSINKAMVLFKLVNKL